MSLLITELCNILETLTRSSIRRSLLLAACHSEYFQLSVGEPWGAQWKDHQSLPESHVSHSFDSSVAFMSSSCPVLMLCSGLGFELSDGAMNHSAETPPKVGFNWNEVQRYSPFNAWPASHKSAVCGPLEAFMCACVHVCVPMDLCCPCSHYFQLRLMKCVYVCVLITLLQG